MKLTLEQADQIAELIQYRQDNFEGEDLTTSILVVLLNYGDGATPVKCIQGEFTGIKSDLPPGEGIPLCPAGHPLFETGPGMALGLVPA
jgi:hypothetical protein